MCSVASGARQGVVGGSALGGGDMLAAGLH